MRVVDFLLLQLLPLQLAVRHGVAAQQQQLLPMQLTDHWPHTWTHERQLAAVGGRGGFGGFSRPSAASRPPASGTYRAQPAPAATAVRPPQPAAPAGRAFGSTALPGGFAAYGRPGFRSTPFILPFAAGLLTASAVSSLARSPTAYCNGRDIQCYKATCQEALNNKCPEAAAGNATLVLSACPDARYSECYRTQGFNDTAAASFECFGVRRPRYGQEDVSAVCHQPGSSSSSAGSHAVNKVSWAGELG